MTRVNMVRALSALFVGMLALVVLPVAPAMADTTIGRLSPVGSAGQCGSGIFADSTYTVPTGGGLITSFSMQTTSANAGEPLKFVVLRKSGGTYSVVGSTAQVQLAGTGIETFPAHIVAQGGDFLAVFRIGVGRFFQNCNEGISGGGGYLAGKSPTSVDPGAPIAFRFSEANKRLNLSANLGKDTPTLTGSAVANGAIGSPMTASAVLSGGYRPTGAVTFKVYHLEGDALTPLATSTAALVDGRATSQPFTPTTTGTYFWVATYGGDERNNAVTSLAIQAWVKVWNARPSVITDAMPYTVEAGKSAMAATYVASGYNLTGNVTWRLFDNPTRTGTPVFTDTANVVDGWAYSARYTPTLAGTYYWDATYNGDANNSPATGGGVPLTVTKASPTLTTTPQPATANAGAPVAATATISGAQKTSGSVTFGLYDNAAGTGTPVFTDTAAVAAGKATSASYVPTSVGTYYWLSTYTGDATNEPAASPAASVTVTKASPTVSASAQPETATVGASVAATATVSGGQKSSGSVTFKLYDNASGTGTPVFTDTADLSDGAATSASYETPHAGTYYWVATYSGDADNDGAATGGAATPVTLDRAAPAIATTAVPTSATVGAPISAEAAVSAGQNPTGTVTFRLYDNPDGTGTPVFVDTADLVGGTATSRAYDTGAAGTYYWVAAYDGDANNTVATSESAAAEVSVVKASPTVTVSPRQATATAGDSIVATATMSGGYRTSGTVTFGLYDNAAGSGAPLFTSISEVVAGAATSAGYRTTGHGALHWFATYSGDAANTSARSTVAAGVTVSLPPRKRVTAFDVTPHDKHVVVEVTCGDQPCAGDLTMKRRAQLLDDRVVLAHTTTFTAGAGRTVRVELRLDHRSRRLLAREGRIRVKVVARLDGVDERVALTRATLVH